MKISNPRCATAIALLALTTAGCGNGRTDVDQVRETTLRAVDGADLGIGRVARTASRAVDEVNVAAATHDAGAAAKAVAVGTKDIIVSGKTEVPGIVTRLGKETVGTASALASGDVALQP